MVDRGCAYLQTNDTHRKLADDQNRSIMVMGIGGNANGGGPILNVQHFLSGVFGGNFLHYPALKYTKDSFIVKLPEGLDKDVVVEAGTRWGQITQWLFRDWSANEEARPQPTRFRVRLWIENFPLDFWEPQFIQQALSGMGLLVHIDTEHILGNDRTKLRVDILCLDPRRIATTTMVPYDNQWKQFFVQIISWDYDGWLPEEARYTVHEQRLLCGSISNRHLHAKSSLLAAHDKLLSFYARGGYTSSPDSPPSDGSSMAVHHTSGTPTVQAYNTPGLRASTQNLWEGPPNHNSAAGAVTPIRNWTHFLNQAPAQTINIGLIKILLPTKKKSTFCLEEPFQPQIIDYTTGKKDSTDTWYSDHAKTKKGCNQTNFLGSDKLLIRVGEIHILQVVTGPHHLSPTAETPIEPQQVHENGREKTNNKSYLATSFCVGNHLIYCHTEIDHGLQDFQNTNCYHYGPTNHSDWAINSQTSKDTTKDNTQAQPSTQQINLNLFQSTIHPKYSPPNHKFLSNMAMAQGTYLVAPDPLQVEALALNQALEQISTMRHTGHTTGYHVLTDSSILAKAVEQANIDGFPSWQAAQIVARSIQLVQHMEGQVLVKFVGRNYVEQAHNMATWARKTMGTFNGYPQETFRNGINVTETLDATRFEYAANT
ncbi:hypothetical protein FCM35_KLT10817 [Carex littledalei]|uniref:Uncharacterized protein n=1 Tax=Carex littledalei TaxID=544730 RepID=A0A833VFW6_9POAL|nr:hypothetical protein FCM35_KLT10817 [Carex littledalei]